MSSIDTDGDGTPLSSGHLPTPMWRGRLGLGADISRCGVTGQRPGR
jgi:hypothetical protein